MKISEFDEKVRVGTAVRYRKRDMAVLDIRRREHLAFLPGHGWVRCSEFGFAGEEGGAPSLRPEPAQGRRRAVVAISPDGTAWSFASVSEAARAFGMSPARVSMLCMEGGKTRQGVAFEYAMAEG